MRLIRFLMKHSPTLLVFAVAAGLAGGAASTALLVVVNTGLSRSSTVAGSLFFMFLGLAGLAMLTRAASALMLATIGENAMLELRLRVTRQILEVPLQKLEEAGIPRLLATVTDDILNMLNAVANVPIVCINVAAVATCLIFLLYASWSLFLIVIGLIFILLISAQIPFIAAGRYFTLSRKEHNTLMGHLRALISGIKELKVNRERKKEFVLDLGGSAARYRAHTLKAMRIAVLGATWAEMLSFITIGLLVFVVPRFMTVSNATLMNFVLIMLYLMEPIEFLQHQAPQFAKGVVAIKSIEDLGLTLARTGTEDEGKHLLPAKAGWKRIELTDAVFSYQAREGNNRFVLGPVNLAFGPGELVFITGGNGSGKTTLGKLLVGLYSPEAGRVELDGVPVSDDEREDYSQLFSAVFADFFLFDKLHGVEKIGLDDKAGTYLRRLQLDHKVKVTDGVLSTVDLSQGERKRLALLAAYLEDRSIFLFDEWAADQDRGFKSFFYQELLPELRAKGKTILVISHDDRYYGVADRIIKLDDGQIVEDMPQTADSMAGNQHSDASAGGNNHNSFAAMGATQGSKPE
jgi:putative pyoverdin transport system ATP-binding/permease protein